MVMEAIEVIKRGERFIAKSSYAQKDIVKAAGFRWDGLAKCWYTTDVAIAEALTDPDAAAKLQAKKQAEQSAKVASIAASRAQDADVFIPVPFGLSYLPYQRAGIAFGLAHMSVLIGDEMGLGKTIQAIGIINSDETLKRILVICPASLKLNWVREMAKWLVRKMSMAIIQGSKWVDAEITIINYDILVKHLDKIQSIEWDCLIADEMHYLKNPDAKRTQAVVGRDATKKKEGKPGIRARRRIGLTGTPIPNRPVEGWPIFHYLDPVTFPKFWYYAQDYCAATQTRWGWDFTGASKLDQLQDKLRASIMVRRKKADVLTELPAKQRQLIEMIPGGASKAVDAENLAYNQHEDEIAQLKASVELAKAGTLEEYQGAVEMLRVRVRAAFTELSDLRHQTAIAKLPQVIEHITDAIADEDHKVVVFAWHKDVIAGIMDALAAQGVKAVSITGDTPMQARQDNVDSFQKDPSCRVFVGNIQAAGVGLTLTASAHVIFAELDWVPGNITQAEDRCHRIGQREMVLVQHLVLDGSLDAKMAKTLIFKQAVLDAALDNEHEIEAAPVELGAAFVLVTEPETPVTTDTPATGPLTFKKVAEIASTLPAAQIEAILEGLRILAGYDMDFARDENGIGFNKADSYIGHRLAGCASLTAKQAVLGQKLCNKYRRQLPAELVAATKDLSSTGQEIA